MSRVEEALGVLKRIDRADPGRREALCYALDWLTCEVGGVSPAALPDAAEVLKLARKQRDNIKGRVGHGPRQETKISKGDILPLLEVLIDLLKRLASGYGRSGRRAGT